MNVTLNPQEAQLYQQLLAQIAVLPVNSHFTVRGLMGCMPPRISRKLLEDIHSNLVPNVKAVSKDNYSWHYERI